MGYTTEFEGKFSIQPPLTEEQTAYLQKFSKTRRMKRSEMYCELMDDPEREAVHLPVGEDGEYFVGGKGPAGQYGDDSILNANNPAPSQPDLWCNWKPTPKGDYLQWNEVENFSTCVEWLEYLIQHFFTPWGRTLNGVIAYRGENFSDFGMIWVRDNKIENLKGSMDMNKVIK